MLRLSQRAWNNVVIFAMLLMVYLFTLSNDILNGENTSSDQKQAVLPPYSVIMSMDLGATVVERIGQDWRITGETSEVLPRLKDIMNNWLALTALPSVLQPASSPYVLSFQLAGEEKQRVYQLYPIPKGILLQHNGDRFLLDLDEIEQLYPVEWTQ